LSQDKCVQKNCKILIEDSESFFIEKKDSESEKTEFSKEFEEKKNFLKKVSIGFEKISFPLCW
jgi:hypothetical protein